MGAGKELRPYQELAIKAIESALERGVSKQVLVLATGLGKTYTAVQVSKKYNRVLWITHTEELLEQSALAFIRERFDDSLSSHIESIGYINYVKKGGLFAGTDFKMGVIKAADFYPNGNIVMASAQTIHRRLDRLDPNTFDLIIADECHYSYSVTWRKTLEFFSPTLLLGLTATPHRSDGMPLGDIYDEIVFDYGIKEGIENKYLCELDAVRVKTTTSLDSVRTTAGELNQKDLAEEINNPQRNQLVVANYIKYAKGRQAIFFCTDIAHTMDLSVIFNEHGISCKPITGDEDITPERSQSIKDFKARKIEVLTNCMVLTHGFDAPNVGCVGMASPTKSLTKYLQCCGRGTRLKDEEFVSKFGQNAIILDYIDNTSRHNLVNAWELDKDKDPEDRVFITQEKRDKLLEARKKKALLNIKREEDERVSLLKIPRPKISKSIRMQEPASEKQLAWIASLGYDVVNDSYTKQMCSQIIMDLPATQKQRGLLKFKGYDVDSVTVLTRGMMEAAMKDLEKREAAKLIKK